MLAVYSPDQADDLLAEGLDQTPILLLMPGSEPLCCDRLIAAGRAGRLHVSIDSPAQLDRLAREAARRRCRVYAHLHVDTGMSRGGLSEAELRHVAERLDEIANVTLAGVMSHFAAADRDAAFTQRQLDRLHALLAPVRERQNSLSLEGEGWGEGDNALNNPLLPHRVSAFVTQRAFAPSPNPSLKGGGCESKRRPIVHAAATAAAARDRCTHLDMARIGVGLYGLGTSLRDGAAPLPPLRDLQPVLSWFTRIVHVQRYPAGGRVGYGDGHVLARDSIIAVVPAGYGDGYPLALTGKARVCVHGPGAEQRCIAPVVGQINMDQMTIDLTDAPHAARLGATVELISADPASPCSVPRLAELAGSSCYEVLCRLSPRVPRCFVNASVDANLIQSVPPRGAVNTSWVPRVRESASLPVR
jgi:alanine racemase